VPIEIELQVVMTLPREGIVVTRYVTTPRQGFSLREESKLNCYLIASLTLAKAVHSDGARRRDLVSFCLSDKTDAGKISSGQYVCLREVDSAGLLGE
jgi:hypothetical protein